MGQRGLAAQSLTSWKYGWKLRWGRQIWKLGKVDGGSKLVVFGFFAYVKTETVGARVASMHVTCASVCVCALSEAPPFEVMGQELLGTCRPFWVPSDKPLCDKPLWGLCLCGLHHLPLQGTTSGNEGFIFAPP